MELLLILTYTGICVAIFKVFKIPINKWTVPTAVLGGIVLLATLFIGMNYNHPYSEVTRSYFVTVPIVPEVSGQVIEVNVEPQKVIEKGEVLLKLDPEPFEANVAALEASLLAASTNLERSKKLIATQSIAQSTLDQIQANVDELRPKLANAKWELDNTIVRAPSRGFTTQVAVRPGIMAVKAPLRPVMVFIPIEERVFIAWFRQNSLMRLKPGYEAEIAFDGLPGTVFSAKVQEVLPAMAEGQIPASGSLIDGAAIVNRFPGRVGVKLYIDDPKFSDFKTMLPGGSFGQAAIYSDHMHHLAVLRKILLRMSSWMNYIYPFH